LNPQSLDIQKMFEVIRLILRDSSEEKLMRNIAYTVIIVFAIIAVHAPVRGGDSSDDMGIGVLLPSSGFKRQGVSADTPEYLVPEGIELCENPADTYSARLRLTESGLNIVIRGRKISVDDRDILLHWEDTGVTALKVSAVRGGYVNILAHTRRGGFWIREADIRKRKYRVTDYLDILRTLKLTVFVIKDAGLNLMDVPDRRGKRIVTIKKGFRFLTTLTGRVKGNWAEADIVELDKSPCDDGKEVKQYHGWLEAVDTDKSPNIFYSDTGC
jgi:hypothetical protein